MRLLLVSGDPSASQIFLSGLEAEGFHVECTDAGEEALSLLRHYEFDTIVVNLSLPDMEGTTLISRMRTAKRDTPVLALTHASSTDTRLRALNAGADDVVSLKIDLLELVARINAIIRRSRGYSQPVLRVGAISLDPDTGTVLANEIPVALTQREFAVFRTLMLRKNMVLNKEALLNALYSGINEPESKIIDVFICKIRSKFAKAGLHDVIRTVWGQGYTVRDNARDSEKPKPHVVQSAGRGPLLAHV